MPCNFLSRLGRVLVASIVTMVCTAGAEQRVTISWQKSFGGRSNETFSVVRHMAGGGYIVAGNSSSPASGNKITPLRGKQDFYVVRISANGTRLWERTFGNTNLASLVTVVPTLDGGVALGGTTWPGHGGNKFDEGYGDRDFWVVKLDARGMKQWDHTYGGSDTDILVSMNRTSDGGFLLGGNSWSLPFALESRIRYGDRWIWKLDANGKKVWSRGYRRLFCKNIDGQPTKKRGGLFG